VALRDGDGPYKSVEDFRYRLGLSLDVVIQISPIVSTLKTPAAPAAGVKANAELWMPAPRAGRTRQRQ